MVGLNMVEVSDFHIAVSLVFECNGLYPFFGNPVVITLGPVQQLQKFFF